MKPLLLLDPTKLTLPERLKLRQDGYDVPVTAAEEQWQAYMSQTRHLGIQPKHPLTV